MKPDHIQEGKVYTDFDGIGCYVIKIIPAADRHQARVEWRRPGMFADKTFIVTLPIFAASVSSEDGRMRVDPASRLPNDGMAVGIPT